MLDMDIKNVGHVSKTRCPALTDADFVKPGADLAAILQEWLTGAAPEQAARPVVFNLAPANPAAQPATATNGDQPATSSIDEDIAAAAGREFVPLAARLLQITNDAVKVRMKALGYTAIPGKPDQRVTAFHALREYQPAAAQPALVTDDPDATTAALATARGQMD